MISRYWRIHKSKKLATSICFVILVGTYAGEFSAATNRGVSFDDNMTIGDVQLSLHGIGLLKWKYLVNVYLVGLYKPACPGVRPQL